MVGIELADSVILDPHKSLFLPWGTGIVVVRDGAALAEALRLAALTFRSHRATIDLALEVLAAQAARVAASPP
jgi:glutamate/tyrosine decarboxylase-like PLP-dependent enzyme